MVVSHGKVIKAFQYLKDIGKIHSQQDLAKAMGKDKSYVSRHVNSESGASDVFIREMCKAFPGIFNLNYFLTDEGEMLADQPKQEQAAPSDNAIISQLLTMLSDKDRRMEKLESTIEALSSRIQRLERAHNGYASVAADDGGVKTNSGI